MSTRPEHDPAAPEQGAQAEVSAEPRANKPEWTRPEITSFKPVSDAQGISYRRGDGLTNSST
jgi:hypothetical protein